MGRTSGRDDTGRLTRVVGVPGAVLMGMGSILGTGIFVSLGIAAGVTGASVILAVALGAVVATFNGLSSAQLAASHPVSGGTYEYGYRYLRPELGFTAGWMFLAAKSASAATAALGFAAYLQGILGYSGTGARTLLAMLGLGLLVVLVFTGIRRSNRVNAGIVSVTLLALGAFVVAGLPSAFERSPENLVPFLGGSGWRGLFHATALMFVAYTGYGRIATLGEEIRDPRRGIPRAIVITLVATMGIYLSVAFVAVAGMGPMGLSASVNGGGAPLEEAARSFGLPGIDWIVAVGAISAMLGVLLNLILGLSRVVLAMARRGDLPRGLSAVHGSSSPRRAVVAVGILVGLLTLSGDVRVTWSFSAFTVLVYYAITNLAALRLPSRDRRYPRWISLCGLVSCLGLAFLVDKAIWGMGLVLIGVGLIWHFAARRRGAGRAGGKPDDGPG